MRFWSCWSVNRLLVVGYQNVELFLEDNDYMQSIPKIFVSLTVTVSLLTLSMPPAITMPATVHAQAAPQRKWNRQIAKSQSSDTVPMFVYLLDRYARNVSGKTELDKAVEVAMAKHKHRRDTAARLIRNFKAIPLAQRQAAFGKFADPTEQTIAAQQIKNTIINSLRAARPDRATKQPPIPDPPLKQTEKGSRSERAEPPPAPEEGYVQAALFRPASFRFTPSASAEPPLDEPLQIRYVGLYCREEAFEDQGSNADEIYLITNVIDVARATSEGSPITHPVGSHDYAGMDTREIREGPVVSVYTGPPKDLTLIVTMMEFDFGDPNAFREDVRLVTDIVLASVGALVGSLGGVAGAIIGAAIGAGIGELIVDLINGLLDTGDDLIEVTDLFLSADDLANMYRQPLQDRRGDRDGDRGRTTVQYHFSTRHNENEDADYFALFRVHDPNLHAVLPGARAEVAPPDLIVSRLEATGSPVVTATGIEVPFIIEVRNQGVAPAAIFKVEVEFSGRSVDFINVPFTVPGSPDTTYPFSRLALSSGRSVVFAGRLVLPLFERGARVSIRAKADSCASDEFLPAHCRVLKSDERNNQSRTITISLPR